MWVETPRRGHRPPAPRPPEPDPYLRRLAGALMVALLIHAVIVGLHSAGVFRKLFPPPPLPEASVESPPVLTLIAPPEPPPPPPAPEPAPERKFLDTTDLPDAPKPEQSRFESAKNTALTAEQTGTSPELAPQQAGKELPGLSLTDRAFSPETPAPPEPATPPAPEPETPTPPTPEPPKETKVSETPPAPSPEPLPGLSLAQVPEPVTPPAPPTPKPQPPQPPKAKPVPKPLSFSMERTRNALEGGALPRGQNSLESEATPLGTYVDGVYQRIGFQWHSAWRNPFKKPSMSVLSYGTVTLKFTVTASGRVIRIRTASSSAGTAVLSSVSMQAIQNAGPFPPFPADVRSLVGDELELDCSFTLF